MGVHSAAEHTYITRGIEQGVRTDGRDCSDFRPIELELGVIPQASGSARLHLGNTDVLVGVKADLGNPLPDAPNSGRLHVTVECSSCASPEYEGRGGELWGTELASALESSLCGTAGRAAGVDLQKLCILAGKTCWVVYVDALLLNDDGNVLDALSCAARVALASTRLPNVKVMGGFGEGEDEDEEPELELDDDPAHLVALDTGRIPIIVTVSQVSHRCVVDLSAEEEPSASASLHIAVDRQGHICGVTKEGSKGVNPTMALEMMVTAQQLAPRLLSNLDGFASAQAALATRI